jgi:tetratricopeptide (TPR) repeat protein
MKRTFVSLIFIVAVLLMNVAAQNELFNKALQQFDAKQYEQAVATFQQVVAQNPEFYQAHFNLGLCQVNLKRYNEAISSFQQAVRIKPDYVRANYWLGVALVNQKRSTEALGWFEKTVQFEPANASAHYRIGLVYQEQKKYPEAEKAFRRASELKPEEADFKTELGNVYINLRKFPEAITVLNDAIRIKPNSASAQLALGNAYYNNNKFVESIPYYKKAGELSPDWATAQLYLADAYYKTRQYELAATTYQSAIRLDNQLAASFYGLGLTYVALKNKTQAQEAAANLRPLDNARAILLQAEIDKLSGAVTARPPANKSAQRIKDEQDVARMADFGFDGAVVVKVGTIRDTPRATGKSLLAVKRGDILSLVSRDGGNDWYRVVDEKTGTEGWIDGDSIVVKLTGNKITGPPLVESGKAATATANPIVIVSNLEQKTTLSLRINGTLYQIPPQTTKSISLVPGKMSYYGWSPGIRATTGNATLESGKQYSWSFKINRP